MTRCPVPCMDHPLCPCAAPSVHTDAIETCPACDATGPCGYDTEGRPLVHTTVFPTAATGSEAT